MSTLNTQQEQALNDARDSISIWNSLIEWDQQNPDPQLEAGREQAEKYYASLLTKYAH